MKLPAAPESIVQKNQKSMAEKRSEWPICCGLNHLCEGWSDNSKLGVHSVFVVSLL